MPTRKIALLVVALLIAGGTVLLARSILSGGGEPSERRAAKVGHEILVATKDLPAGTILKDSDIEWYPWPAEGKTDNYAVKGQTDKAAYIGNVVRYGMRAGEPIVVGRVVKPGQSGFMAAALAPGMRAISISTSAVAGVAGFIFPGDHVDVIVTRQIGGRGGTEGGATRKVSETILRDVRVLALDQRMDDQATTPKVAQTATLEVTGKQAETVALAGEMGTLSLALRSIARDIPQNEKPATAAGADSIVLNEDSPPGLTWDSDVSSAFLPSPSNRTGLVQKITVIRGKEVSESVYDLTSPEGNE